jgi:hypothetical protein
MYSHLKNKNNQKEKHVINTREIWMEEKTCKTSTTHLLDLTNALSLNACWPCEKRIQGVRLPVFG